MVSQRSRLCLYRFGNMMEGADISVYDTGGKILGSSTAINGNANIAIPQTDKIAIVKIGNKAVKVSLK